MQNLCQIIVSQDVWSLKPSTHNEKALYNFQTCKACIKPFHRMNQDSSRVRRGEKQMHSQYGMRCGGADALPTSASAALATMPMTGCRERLSSTPNASHLQRHAAAYQPTDLCVRPLRWQCSFAIDWIPWQTRIIRNVDDFSLDLCCPVIWLSRPHLHSLSADGSLADRIALIFCSVELSSVGHLLYLSWKHSAILRFEYRVLYMSWTSNLRWYLKCDYWAWYATWTVNSEYWVSLVPLLNIYHTTILDSNIGYRALHELEMYVLKMQLLVLVHNLNCSSNTWIQISGGVHQPNSDS